MTALAGFGETNNLADFSLTYNLLNQLNDHHNKMAAKYFDNPQWYGSHSTAAEIGKGIHDVVVIRFLGGIGVALAEITDILIQTALLIGTAITCIFVSTANAIAEKAGKGTINATEHFGVSAAYSHLVSVINHIPRLIFAPPAQLLAINSSQNTLNTCFNHQVQIKNARESAAAATPTAVPTIVQNQPGDIKVVPLATDHNATTKQASEEVSSPKGVVARASVPLNDSSEAGSDAQSSLSRDNAAKSSEETSKNIQSLKVNLEEPNESGEGSEISNEKKIGPAASNTLQASSTPEKSKEASIQSEATPEKYTVVKPAKEPLKETTDDKLIKQNSSTTILNNLPEEQGDEKVNIALDQLIEEQKKFEGSEEKVSHKHEEHKHHGAHHSDHLAPPEKHSHSHHEASHSTSEEVKEKHHHSHSPSRSHLHEEKSHETKSSHSSEDSSDGTHAEKKHADTHSHEDKSVDKEPTSRDEHSHEKVAQHHHEGHSHGHHGERPEDRK